MTQNDLDLMLGESTLWVCWVDAFGLTHDTPQPARFDERFGKHVYYSEDGMGVPIEEGLNRMQAGLCSFAHRDRDAAASFIIGFGARQIMEKSERERFGEN